MFLPIRDDNPHTVTPFVNYTMLAICIVVYVWQFSLGAQAEQRAVLTYGFTPAYFFGPGAPAEFAAIPATLTMFTSMFMHGGWMHLGGNMLYLWIFGDNIEASLGHGRYLAFYLLCGVAAALAQGFAAPGSDIPMVGASGAISGVLGAYLVLHPRSNIKVFVFLIIITVINVPAFIVLGFWIVGQLVSSAAVDAGQPGVALHCPHRRIRGRGRHGVLLQEKVRPRVRRGAQPALRRRTTSAPRPPRRLSAAHQRSPRSLG